MITLVNEHHVTKIVEAIPKDLKTSVTVSELHVNENVCRFSSATRVVPSGTGA